MGLIHDNERLLILNIFQERTVVVGILDVSLTPRSRYFIELIEYLIVDDYEAVVTPIIATFLSLLKQLVTLLS